MSCNTKRVGDKSGSDARWSGSESVEMVGGVVQRVLRF